MTPSPKRPYTDNVKPIPVADLQAIFGQRLTPPPHLLQQVREEDMRLNAGPSLTDELAEFLRDPIGSYLLGIASGAAATVIAAMLWAGVL